MAIEARQNVTRWAAEHFAYRAPDVAELASLFDGVIADVRAASGAKNTNLALVANMAAPPDVPMMAAPDLQESTEQAIRAAALTTDTTERTSLLRAIAESLSSITNGETLGGSAQASRVHGAGDRRTHRPQLFDADVRNCPISGPVRARRQRARRPEPPAARVARGRAPRPAAAAGVRGADGVTGCETRRRTAPAARARPMGRASRAAE